MSALDPPAPVGPGVASGGGVVPANPDYPVKFDVVYTPEASRLELLLRIIKIIPPFFYAWVMGFVFFFHYVVQFFTVLFTGTVQRDQYEFMTQYMRFQQWLSAYAVWLTDEVPPMSLDQDPRSPVTVEIPYNEQVPNWRALIPWWGIFWKFVGFFFYLFVAYFMAAGMFLTILFTGRRPEGSFRYLALTGRSMLRFNAYMYLLTNERPPLWG